MPKPSDESRPDDDPDTDDPPGSPDGGVDDVDDGYLSDVTDPAELRNLARRLRNIARKHERRANAKAQEVDDLKAENGTLKQERMSDQEREVTNARSEGEKDGRRKAAEEMVPAVFKIAGKDRIPDPVLNGIDPTKFLTEDGAIDVDAVTAFIDGIAPPDTGTESKPKDWPDTGAGNRGGAPKPGGLDAGREMARQRHGTPDNDKD